jgi:large subunit ribosomal protein L21
MYAIIQSGGKQYRVSPGDTVKIERLGGKVGEEVTFDQVVAVRTDEKLLAGKDAAGARVTGKIVRQGRHPKELVMKFKKTKQYKILRGHRQNYSAVEVTDIRL